MMTHRTLYFLLSFTFLAPATVLAADAPVACAQKSVVASAVRTQGDVQAFVQCAYEFVREVGFQEARQAFNEDDRWRSGPTYIPSPKLHRYPGRPALSSFHPTRRGKG